MSHHMEEEDERTLQREKHGNLAIPNANSYYIHRMPLFSSPFCRPYLKTIEEEEEPCKDGGVGVDGQQPNHPGEPKEGKEDHHCFHQGTLQKEGNEDKENFYTIEVLKMSPG